MSLRIMLRIGIVVMACGLAALTVLLLNTWRFPARQLPGESPTVAAVHGHQVAEKLAAALRIPTISPQEPEGPHPETWHLWHVFVQQAFPSMHKTLHRESVGPGSVLYTWHGQDPTLAPVVLLGHFDVVPIAPGTAQAWSVPPFAGAIADGYVWGRGALDDKAGVICLQEAVDSLVQAGFQPRRTLYLAFGHDEELGGGQGALLIANLLRARGIKPVYVLDEWSPVVSGLLPGLTAPVALIGIAEKGFLNMELSTEMPGGHSSMPPRDTAIGLLSRAITRLEAQPLPARQQGPLYEMLQYVGPEMPLLQRVIFANLWLFGALVQRRLAASPATNAALRTTMAPTMIHSGIKDNVLPAQARAVVNVRILPGDSQGIILEHMRRAINDPRVHLRPLPGVVEPPPVTPTNTAGFAVLHRTIRQLFPEAVVAPSLVVGGTDARHYAPLTDTVLRFRPFRLTANDLQRFHGIDERISIANVAQGVQFFAQLIRNTDTLETKR